MNLKSKILGFLGVTSAVAGSALSHAVVAVAQKGNPIGDAAIAAVTAAEADKTVPGAKKKADVLAAVKPVVMAELAKGSLAAIEADIETFASMVIEEIVAQVKQTGPLAIALQLLALLGIK